MRNADRIADNDLQAYVDAEFSVARIAGMYRVDAAVVRAKIAQMQERQRQAAVLITRQEAFEAGCLARPHPPPALCDDLRHPAAFQPAPDAWEWFLENFVQEDGALFNADHAHLAQAHVAVLWTNVPYFKGGRQIAGMAEMPSCQGNVWAKARHDRQLCEWFGAVPDFLITLDAPLAATCSDATFCARLEHEAHHCGHKCDEFGCPKYRKDGSPAFFLKPHDAEEFVSVVRRYGVGAAAGGVAELVQAAALPPLIAAADVEAICGTCGR